MFLLFGSGVGGSVSEGRECFFPTPEKMRDGKFVYCVIGVYLLIVFVTIGKRVRRMEATAMTRDSRMRGKGGCTVCVFSGVYICLCECEYFWSVVCTLLLVGVSDFACVR